MNRHAHHQVVGRDSPAPSRRPRRAVVLATLCAALVFSAHTDTRAQGRQTGTIRGVALDAQGLTLPGVTVTVNSTSLQGIRTAVTGASGGYELVGLPPGEYSVVFLLDGFDDVSETAVVSLGGQVGVNAVMAPAGVTETVNVLGVVPTPIATIENSSNMTDDEINALPVGRSLFGIAAVQPELTTNTPNGGQVTINGAFAYDNVFLVDGVDINDNLFGTSNGLFIEDAIEETQVITSGISAEYGRFSGGVINAITKSGGNLFSGSFRANMWKPTWTARNPYEEENEVPREGDLADNTTYETTLGGPIVRDRLWFFAANRIQRRSSSEVFDQTGISYDETSQNDRYQAKLTGTLAPGHTLAGSYMRSPTASGRPTFGFSLEPTGLIEPEFPNDLVVATYRGAIGSNLAAEVQYSQKRQGFRNFGGTSSDIFDSPFITVWQGLGHYNAPYFDATDPEDRNNRQVTGNVTWFHSSPTFGSHSVKAGFERYTSTNTGGNSQSSTGFVFYAPFAEGPDGAPLLDAGGRLFPVFEPFGVVIQDWRAVRGARIDINTTSFFVNDTWTLDDHLSFNLGVRGETVDSEATGGIQTVDAGALVPRLGVAYDPAGNGRLALQATYSHYSGKYSETQFASITNVGNPSVLEGVYVGPAGQGRDFAPGFDPANYFTYDATFPTRNVFNDPNLRSPLTKELTLSAGGALGTRSHLKLTFIQRATGGVIEDFLDLTTGETEIVEEGESFGTFVNQVLRNTDALERRYRALVLDTRVQATRNFLLDGSWTVQLSNEGNFEGEGTNTPGSASNAFDWPEVTPAARYFPYGRLNDFQKHKVRLWGIYNLGLGRLGRLDLGGMWRYDSGLTYSLASGGVALTPVQEMILADLGYASTPSTRTIFYGGRGTEDFAGYTRLDLSVQWELPIWREARPWLKAEVYNVLNNDTLLSWDTTVDPNFDGAVDELGLPTSYTEGPRFGEATGAGDYPNGREYRVALGFRF